MSATNAVTRTLPVPAISRKHANGNPCHCSCLTSCFGADGAFGEINEASGCLLLPAAAQHLCGPQFSKHTCDTCFETLANLIGCGWVLLCDQLEDVEAPQETQVTSSKTRQVSLLLKFPSFNSWPDTGMNSSRFLDATGLNP